MGLLPGTVPVGRGVAVRLRAAFHVRRPRLSAARVEAVAVGGFFLLLAVALSRVAAVRPLWFDEVFTVRLARVASVRELLRLLANGADLNPPLSYLAVRASVSLFGETLWAVRLPSLAGGLVGVFALYLFARRRGGPSAGWVAAALVPLGPSVWFYFTECRPYGLATGFAGLALVCWQRAAEAGDAGRPRGGWLAGLAAAFALGVSAHYHFALAVAGLGLGEAVRTLHRRKLDRAAAACFAVAVLAVLAYAPLWAGASRDYAPGFWAKVTLGRAAVEKAYTDLVNPAAVAPLVAGLLLAAFVGAVVGRRKGDGGPWDYRGHEVAALVGLALGPVLGVTLAGAGVTPGYHLRYAVPSALGLAGVGGYAVARVGGGRVPLALAGAVFVLHGAAFEWTGTRRYFAADARASAELAAGLGRYAAGETVLIESAFDFTRVWHENPSLPFRPLYVADPAAAFRATKQDTVERGALALGWAAGAPVVGWDAVTAAVDRGEPVSFYGLANGWVAGELRSRGLVLEPRDGCGGWPLFRLKRSP